VAGGTTLDLGVPVFRRAEEAHRHRRRTLLVVDRIPVAAGSATSRAASLEEAA
jgi:hypothetical protein